MANDQEQILEKIKYFELEVLKAEMGSNFRIQHDNLEKVYSDIVKYLESDIENANPESRIIEMTVGALQYTKRTYMKYEFIKDPKKEVKIRTEKIANIKSDLLTNLKVLRSYVAKNSIVIKGS